MLTQEVNQSYFIPIEELPYSLQEAIKVKVCINCERELDKYPENTIILNSEKKIHYVILSNNEIMWWHDFNNTGILTSSLRRRLCPIKKIFD